MSRLLGPFAARDLCPIDGRIPDVLADGLTQFLGVLGDQGEVVVGQAGVDRVAARVLGDGASTGRHGRDITVSSAANKVDTFKLAERELSGYINPMTTTDTEAEREAIVATIAASEALKPAGQQLINRIPGFENIRAEDQTARYEVRYSDPNGGYMLVSGRRVKAGPFVTRALAMEFAATACHHTEITREHLDVCCAGPVECDQCGQRVDGLTSAMLDPGEVPICRDCGLDRIEELAR